MTDAKEMWDAIKFRFSGNDESKKMQKYILKQQFKGFSVSNSEGLHKGYDRFQSLMSQLKIHGAGVSTKDANQKFLRSLPFTWSQVSLIMRTKPGVDSLSFDDLYNNIRVFENDVKGSTASSSSTCPQLDHEDLEQLDEYDLEEMDLKWQVAMILMRMKKFYKKTGHFARECRIKGNQDNRRRNAWNSRNKDGSRTGKKEDSKALVTIDGEEAMKEKEDLKAKVEKWHNSSKNLGKLLNTQMSANDKFRLGYGDHRYDEPSDHESETAKQVEFDTSESNIIPKTPELVSEPVVNESNVACQPKVWSDAPIIEEYESDSEDEYVSIPTKEQETPSFGLTSKSLNHLIRDYDFHEKMMAKQAQLNNRLNRNSSQREIRPIWNNVQRVNNQNQFVPTAVLTRTGKIPVNTARASGTKNVSTARHSFNKQAVPTSVAMKVNTVKPIVNRVRPPTIFHKTHSPFSRPFNKTTTLRTNFSKQKVNTAKVNAVSAVGGKRETAVKPSAGSLQNKGMVDSGCSRYMTGNKAYLAEYQDFNGGPVAFGGSKGYITGKGKIKIGKLDFEDVCFVKELQHFNLFFVSQMCDKKNKVLFTDSECLLTKHIAIRQESSISLQNKAYCH
ncbi:hypothetical protein Tco_1157541 [Tanacetum coccineum]